jgi:hypothetical protein
MTLPMPATGLVCRRCQPFEAKALFGLKKWLAREWL